MTNKYHNYDIVQQLLHMDDEKLTGVHRNIEAASFSRQYSTRANTNFGRSSFTNDCFTIVNYTATNVSKSGKVCPPNPDTFIPTFDGVNAKLIDSYGHVNLELVMSQVRDLPSFRKSDEANSVAYFDRAVTGYESHHRWLYNMAATALRSTLIETSSTYDATNHSAHLVEETYFDSHYRATRQGCALTHTREYKLDAGSVRLNSRPARTIEGTDCSINLPELPGDMTAFAVAHLGERVVDGNLNFEFAMPTIAQPTFSTAKDVQLQIKKYFLFTQGELHFLPSTISHTRMWAAIRTIVSHLRLTSEWVQVLDILGILTFRPTPDSVEGALWPESPATLYLPEFYSMRSTHPIFTKSVPYDRYQVGLATASTLLYCNVVEYLVRFSNYNYHSMLGVYESLHRIQLTGAGTLSDVLGDGVLNPHTHFSTCLAAATAKLVTVSLQNGIGVIYDYSNLVSLACGNHTGITVQIMEVSQWRNWVDNSIPPAGLKEADRITIKTVPLPTSPSPLFGAVSDHYSSLNQLKPFAIKKMSEFGDTEMSYDRETTLSLAQFYRIHGYDICVTEDATQRNVQLWAPSSGKFIRGDLSTRAAERFYFYSSEPRKNASRFVPTPDILPVQGMSVDYHTRLVNIGAFMRYRGRMVYTKVKPKLGKLKVLTTFRFGSELQAYTHVPSEQLNADISPFTDPLPPAATVPEPPPEAGPTTKYDLPIQNSLSDPPPDGDSEEEPTDYPSR